jgi:hypothetical protein
LLALFNQALPTPAETFLQSVGATVSLECVSLRITNRNT